MSTWSVLNSPGVPIVLYIFSHTMLLALAYTAVMPTFLYTPVDEGGIGFDPTWISYTIALAGASQALWLLFVFPSLQKNIGTGNLLRCCAAFWPLFMASLPIYNEFVRHGYKTAFWITAPVFTVLGSGVAMAFGAYSLRPWACTQYSDFACSMRTTLSQRYFAFAHRSCDSKCAGALPQLRRASCCASPVQQHIRAWCEDRLGRWPSCLVHSRRACFGP